MIRRGRGPRRLGHRRPARSAPIVTAGVVALAATVGLVACGADRADTLDREATEEAVAEVVADGLRVGVDDVACPAEIERSADTVVTCRAALSDDVGEVRVEVRQTDDEGSLDLEVLDAVIDRGAVADQLAAELAGTFERDFTADCGTGGLEVMAPGSSFVCDAADADGTREVTVTVTDAAGTLRFDLGDDPDADGGPLGIEPTGPEEGG